MHRGVSHHSPSSIEPRTSQEIMCSFEALLRGHEQIDRVARPSNPLPVPFGIGEDLSRLREQVAARGHRYCGTALSAKWLVLLAGDDQDALGVGWGLGKQDVCAQVFPRRDDVFPLPPYLSKLLLEVNLVVGTKEGVGPGWLVW